MFSIFFLPKSGRYRLGILSIIHQRCIFQVEVIKKIAHAGVYYSSFNQANYTEQQLLVHSDVILLQIQFLRLGILSNFAYGPGCLPRSRYH